MGEAVELKLRAVVTSQYQKLNTWFHRRIQFLCTVPLLGNYDNGCMSFLEASAVKGGREGPKNRKMEKLLALRIFIQDKFNVKTKTNKP